MRRFDNPILSKFLPLLPALALIIVIFIDVAFVSLVILPQSNINNDLASQVAINETAVAQMPQPGDDLELLQLQINNAQTSLNESGGSFLLESQTDDLLDKLYQYAAQSGVKITNLQAQVTVETTDVSAYDVRPLRFQIEGLSPQLLDFVVHIKELTIPSVVIANFNIQEESGKNILIMDFLLYTSPFASGEALTNLPEKDFSIPLLQPTSTPTLITNQEVGTVMPTPTTLVEPTVTLMASFIGAGTYDDSHPAITYTTGNWVSIDSYRSFGNSYHFSDDAMAEARINFIGTAIAVQYVSFRTFGIFEIYVDDTLWGEVDAYAPDGQFGQVVYITGLPSQAHTLIIRNTPRHNPASSGNAITIDAIYVLETTPSISATPGSSG